MAPSGQLTAPALQALLQDGMLAGDWTLDPARSEVHRTPGTPGASSRCTGALSRFPAAAP